MNTLQVDRRSIRSVALAAVLAAGVFAAQAPLKVGDLFPDLAVQNLEGKLPDTKGKVVLVDFWASWCVPCAKSFPLMEELHQQFKGRGLVVVAVSVDEKASDMDKFLKKYPVSFAVARDAAQKLVAIANVEAMPTSFLLDREGRVRFVHNGFHGDETKKQYLTEIELLLKGTP
jgi:thiol-disulfide isomerase/thioredoxin